MSRALRLALAAAAAFLPAQRVHAQDGLTEPFPYARAVRDWITEGHAFPWLAGAIGFAALFLTARHRMRLHRRRVRREVSGLPDAARFRVLDAMSHVIRRNGRVSAERLRRAVEIARQVTDMDYSGDHLREMALRADRFIHPLSFRWMRRGLTREEKLLIFNATASTIVASGGLSRSDRSVLRNLGGGLGLKRRDLRDLARLLAA
jgi:hypothetical protein